MNGKYIIIGDVHGAYQTLMALLAKCPTDRTIILVGDLIDRGPRSRQVIDWAMTTPNVKAVMGNHEHMCLASHGTIEPGDYGLDKDFAHDAREASKIWLGNGGINCLDSYPPIKNWEGPNPPGKMLVSHLVWMAALPTFIRDGNLMVSHTGWAKPDYPAFDSVWAQGNKFPEDGLYRVYGHTPQKQIVVGLTHTNIDSGAFIRGERGKGKLTAFLWPEKTILQQNYCDTVLDKGE